MNRVIGSAQPSGTTASATITADDPSACGWAAAGWGFILAIVVTAVADPFWRANPVFHDHWIYHGFQRNLGPHVRDFAWTYWATRLPTIVPGALAHRLFAPATAEMVLHAGLLAVSLVAARECARRMFGERAGALAVVFAGTHFFFLQGMASDYTEGYGVCWFLLTTACVLRALEPASRCWWLWGFAAGVFYACFGLTNVAFWLLTPILAGLAVAGVPLGEGGARAFLIRLAGLCLLGALGCFAALATADAWFHARSGVHLWQPNLHFLRNFKDDETYAIQAATLPFSAWAAHAAWLVWPTVAAVIGCMACAASLRRERGGRGVAGRRLAWLTLVLAGSLALTATERVSQTDSFSRHWYYAVPLYVPCALLVMAGAVDRYLPAGAGLRRFVPAAFLLAVGMAAVFGAGEMAGPVPSRDALVFAGSVVAGVAGFGLVLISGQGRSPALLFVGLALMAGIQAPIRSMFRVDAARPPSVVEFAMLDRCRAIDTPARREAAAAIEEAVGHCLAMSPENDLGLWYDERSPMAPVFEMVNAAFAYGRILSKDMADIRLKPLGGMQVGLEPGRVVVVLSDDLDTAYSAVRRDFERLSIQARELPVREIAHGPVRFFLVPYLVEKAPEALAGTQGRVRR